jgi:hypothetical protein
MGSTATATAKSNSVLQDEIKKLIKTEFEKSVQPICSEEGQKRVPTVSEQYSNLISNYVAEIIENPSRDKKLVFCKF